jgi:hypothetical protein
VRQLIIISLLVVTSCPTPTPDACERQRVSMSGVIEKHKARFGGGPQTQRWPAPDVRIPHEPISLRMIAPFTSCDGDALEVTVTVRGPNDELIGAVSTPVALAADSHVESTVTFTPPRPGTYTVQADFGADLGTRSDGTTVTPFPAGTAVPISLPPGVTCDAPAWPVSATSIACEAGNTVSVIEADGGVQTFEGQRLVAIDDVLWSENDAGVLERREAQNGTFAVTHQFPGFGAPPVRGFHTKRLAVRRRADLTSVTLGMVRTAGAAVDRTFTNSDPQLDLYFFEGVTVQAATQGSAVCSECFPDVVALDATLLWQQAPNTPYVLELIQGGARSQADVVRRLQPVVSLGHDAKLGLPALAPLERWPLFVDAARSDLMVLFEHRDDGGVAMSAWPRTGVLHVGPSFATLVNADGGLAIAPLAD